MSKFIVDADDMEWGAATPSSADEVELLELALILYRRNKPEAERLALTRSPQVAALRPGRGMAPAARLLRFDREPVDRRWRRADL